MAGQGARTGRKSAERRRAILGAAARRIAEFGFEATTVRQIANDVKILSGSLYHHFATKEEILGEIVRDAVLDQRDRALRIAGCNDDAQTKLIALIREELAALAGNNDAYAIIFNERKLFRRNPVFEDIIRARKETFDAWSAVLEQGVSDGAFHSDVDSYLTISTVMRMLNNGADWYCHEDGSPIDAKEEISLETLTNFYVGFVLRSVRSAGRTEAPMPSAARAR